MLAPGNGGVLIIIMQLTDGGVRPFNPPPSILWENANLKPTRPINTLRVLFHFWLNYLLVIAYHAKP